MQINHFRKVAIALLFAVVVTGCNKNASKPQQTVGSTGDVTATGANTVRAKFVANLPVDPSITAAIESDMGQPYVLCAQLTIPNAGTYANQTIVELSMPADENCPADGLVSADPNSIIVSTFSWNNSSSSPNLDIVLDGTTIGMATGSSAEPGDPNSIPTALKSLCDSDPNATYGTPCYFQNATYFIGWN